LEENVAAVGIELTASDVNDLSDAFPVGAAAGDRYTPEAMKFLEAESI
jgi:hypothetical protein